MRKQSTKIGARLKDEYRKKEYKKSLNRELQVLDRKENISDRWKDIKKIRKDWK